MHDIADELRRVLADRALEAPPGLELPSAAKDRARRRATRNRVTYAGLATLAVVIGASAVPMLLHDNRPQQHPGGSPATTGPPTTSPASACAVQFASATTQPTVSFPYTPTFVPTGLPPASVLRTYADFIMHARQLDDGVWLKVERHDAAPVLADVPGLSTAPPQSVRIRGHAGKLATGDGQTIYVYWQETSDTWLSIHSVGVSREDVLRYADGLQATPLSGTEAYHFDLVPVDMDLHESLHYSMTFAPSSATPATTEPLIGVTVDKAGTTQPPPGSTAVQVGSNPGHLSTQDGGRNVLVDLPGGAKMEVSVPIGCADADLVSFAAGITVDLNSI